MTICEGVISELKILENMTVDEYYAAVNSYMTYKENVRKAQEEAYERAKSKK